MKTRQDYMDKKCTHAEYYGQFVSNGIKQMVARTIGIDRIRASKDEHLNDIPLSHWDAMAPAISEMVTAKVRKCGDFVSLSTCVCIAKVAARQILAFAD